MYVILALLLIYVSCIAFVWHRNQVHFGLGKQLSDFSTFMVPFNLPAYWLSKVPNTHCVEASYFPELKIIEDNWQIIRDEAIALYQLGHIAAKDDLPASSFYKNDRWKSFYLKLYNHRLPSAYSHAPKTMEILNQVPNLNLALFALLMPGKKLNNHHDPFAYTLRYSLGLVTPNSEKCGLTINGEKHPFYDGKGIIFDETYFHNAYNDSDQIRLILMTDIDRPLKSRLVQKLYYAFGWTFNRLFMQDNLDSGHTGFGNKVGQWLLAYQRFLKRIKKANKPLYTTGKTIVILALLVWLGSLIV